MSKIKLKYCLKKTIVGVDAPLDDLYFEQTNEAKYPMLTNQTPDNGCAGYVPYYLVSEECLSISTRASMGNIFYHNYPLLPTGRILLIFNNKNFSLHYLKWCLRNVDWTELTKGAAQPVLNEEIVVNIYIPNASLSQQTQISNYLDKKCAVIDKTIELCQRKIDLLTKYKKSLIDECVNEGIPNMKITKRERIRMKYCLISYQKGVGITKNECENDGIVPCILYGELYTEYFGVINNIKSRTNFSDKGLIYAHKNDIITPLTTTADIYSMVEPSVINVESVIIGGDILDLKLSKNWNPYYVSYFLKSHSQREKIISNANGSTGIKHLKARNFLDSLIPTISPLQQTQISNYLDKKCAVIDKTIDLTSKKVKLLQAYRKSLINEQVNGGIYA